MRTSTGARWASSGCSARAASTESDFENLEGPARARRELRLGLVGDQAFDRAREMAQRVLGGGGHRCVAGAPEDPQAQRRDPLLADRDRHHAAAVGELEQLSPALVDREVAAQVRPFTRQPREADVGGVLLLVGLGDEDHVAGRLHAAAGELGERDGPCRDLALHVGGPATDEQPVALDARERVDGPVVGRRRHDVGVAEQHRRGTIPTLDSGDHVQALGIGADELGLDAGKAQVPGEQLGGNRLAPRRVRRVEADQLLCEVEDLGAQVGHPRRAASSRTCSTGNASCIVPSRSAPGSAATRQL